MESVAYFELAQTQENPEVRQLNFSSVKVVTAAVGVASTAWAGGLLAAAPASACGYSCYRPIAYNPCCRPVLYRPISYYRPCHNYCYYPQHYSTPSYEYPDYYSYDHSESYSHYDSYSYHASSEGDYQEVAYYPIAPNLLQFGSSGEIVAALQQALTDLGYDPGAVDGLYGYQTEAAVAEYQAATGLAVDGIAGGETLDSLGLAGAGA